MQATRKYDPPEGKMAIISMVNKTNGGIIKKIILYFLSLDIG